MSLIDLPALERNIAFQCLQFILEGGQFEEDEFQTRLGLTRPELEMLVSKWPRLDDKDNANDDYRALNNCFNEVCNGLSFSQKEWQAWFSVPRTTVREAFAHWLQSFNVF